MKQEKILFEKALKRLNIFWKFSGIQIYYKKDKRNISFLERLRMRWFYITSFISLISGTLSFYLIIHTLSAQVILYMVPCTTIVFLGSIKTIFFLYNEDKISDIIATLSKLQSMDDSEGKDVVDKEFVEKRLPFLIRANVLLLAICFTGVTAFFIGPVVIIIWQYWLTNEIKLFLPYVLWYPFDEYSLVWWPLAYVHQFWSAWTAVFYIYGTDCFFYTVCAFIHNQFYSLQFDMSNIDQESFDDNIITNTKFMNLIQRHKELIRCVDMINEVYGISTLYNVLSSSFIICLGGFNVKILSSSWSYFTLLNSIYSKED